MDNDSYSVPEGPWGEDDVMLYRVCNDRGASVVSAADALREFVGDYDDWQDYAIAVTGPLMYHAIPGDYDQRIEPCECEDEHEGQVEVWRVQAQQQEPTARAQERRRWARVLDKVAADHLAVATEKREQAMEAHGEGDDHTYRKRMDSGGTHKTLADTYHRIARRIEANDAR